MSRMRSVVVRFVGYERRRRCNVWVVLDGVQVLSFCVLLLVGKRGVGRGRGWAAIKGDEESERERV